MLSLSTLKNRRHEKRIFTHRLIVVYIFIALLVGFLIGRLFYLQIFEHKKYTTLSQKNQLNIIPIPPTRGVIYDRNGVLLAENIPAYNLEIIPDHVKNLTQTIEKLQQLVPSIDNEDVKTFDKLKRQHRSFDSIPLHLSLTPEEVAVFSVNQYRFPGVSIKARLIRHYPLKELFSHVLGYVARISQTEWEKLDRVNYSATNFIGKIGIEKYYENILHGTVGYEQVETDASGRIVRTLHRKAPEPGQELYLTIDSRLQQTAEEALGENRGAVIAIIPDTGEIVAMVSKPGYNPNLFVRGIPQKVFNELARSPDQPLYNRAIRGQYPFASTIKPFFAIGALEQGIVSSTYKIYDPGWFKLPTSSHRYRDWRKGGHGWVDVTLAIIVSCDTYFYNLASLTGIIRMGSTLRKFGFGQLTGIDMGEELPGLVASPEWKRAVKGASWYPGDTIATGIGQGYMLTTPLQLASGVAAISQHGKRYTPHLLLKTRTPDGDIQLSSFAEKPSVELKHYEIWDKIIRAMEMVIKDPRGTGGRFGRDARYSAAIKTGTAQVFTVKQNEDIKKKQLPAHLRDHSLLIGFAPVDEPQIAVAVLVENSHEASFVARKVIDAYLLKLAKPDENIYNLVS